MQLRQLPGDFEPRVFLFPMSLAASMLRIRFEGRPHSVKYPDSGRLKDLVAKITEVTGASTESLTIKAGYPPVSIGSLTSDRDLLACGIRPGDQVTVETTSRTKSQTATSATEDYESKLTLLPKSSARSDCSVAVDGGHLVLRTVPDDNSCLFRSVAIALAGGPEAATSLRSSGYDSSRCEIEWCHSRTYQSLPMPFVKIQRRTRRSCLNASRRITLKPY